MSNINRIQIIFASSLNLPLEKCTDELAYGIDWDSVAHMSLIAALEDEFGIMIDTNDVIDMSSFKKAKEILTKYGVASQS